MHANHPHLIEVSQLRVGLYVHLDLSWMDHPFTLSHFKIKDETQIKTIKKIGLKKLRYDPHRSDCEPLDQSLLDDKPAVKETELTENKIDTPKPRPITRHERLKQMHAAIDEAEGQFISAGNVIKESTKNILVSPKAAIEQTAALVNSMVETALTEGDIAIHAINGNTSTDAHYLHPLNVTVLSLMLAKSVEITPEDARLLGMAAVFHDIGKIEISSNILLKKEPLTKQEQSHFEQHSEIGARMAKEVGLPARIGKIILQHHVYEDGSGYPKQFEADYNDPLVHIIALTNWFDNLCNPNDISQAKTPYEALAKMYAQHRSKFDEKLIKCFIKCLGIYPPGSIVKLSNGMHGIVISVTPNQPLRPYVMLHDPLVRREAARIVNLAEELEMSVKACLRPNQLPKDALDYLNPRKRLSYYMGAELPHNEVSSSSM